MNSHESCPKCHNAIEQGYGLAFGGFGAYQYCQNEACDWYEKDRECPACEGVGEHDPGCTVVASERRRPLSSGEIHDNRCRDEIDD